MAVPCTTQVFLFFLLSIVVTLNIRLSKGNLNMTCNEKERMALLKFKNGLIDPSNRLSSWSDQEDCCSWPEVRCNNVTGQVTELDLSNPLNNRYLSGEISPSLLELKSLIYLNLSMNYFGHSTIPTFLGSMEALRYLDLRYTGFMGLIPHNLGNLSKLEYLNLGYNYALVVDNFNWMSKLSSLKYLDLSGVDLHKQLDWLHAMSSLPSLSELHFENCQIGSIIPPKRNINFTSLQVLDISNNYLNQEIPSWLANLSSSLVELNLRSNFLSGGVPQMISGLQNLKSLGLQGNQLSGFISDSLGQLKQLEVLDLSKNAFTGPIPLSFANLSSLRELNLGHNQLNGTIPKSFGFLQNLQALSLGSNSVTGGVPKTIGNLSNLLALDLGLNPLVGQVDEVHFLKLSKLKKLSLSSTNLFLKVNLNWTPPFQLEHLLVSSCGVGLKFPVWLQTQTSLKVLSMSESGISDQTPSWFWNWTLSLEFLDISNNEIRGELSNVFLNSSNLILSSNHFNGQLPRVSPHVEVLNVANNSISGPISHLFCEGVNGNNALTVLDASYNLLSGELGYCWMHWQALMHLNLGTNNLSGEIPDSIGYLYGLESLRLHNNGLSGYIPPTLQNCSLLKVIDMGHNLHSGTLPVWMWEMQNLMILRLRSNQFKGDIDQRICQFSSLIVLDLANNSLSGSIPMCLDNMKTMARQDDIVSNPLQYTYGFDLNYDKYRDSVILVPKGDELEYTANLILVRMIDLSSNELSGPIPLEISSLCALRFLNLSRNQLSGEIPKEMGGMKLLESLDLSANSLSGEIPQSLSDLSFLSYLNLSYNNLSGRIPTSTQLQSFDALSYTGNSELCGPPLPSNCTKNEELEGDSLHEQDGEGFFSTSEFYMGMGVGFAAGFLGVCSLIFFSRTCRLAYFQFLYHLKSMFC